MNHDIRHKEKYRREREKEKEAKLLTSLRLSQER